MATPVQPRDTMTEPMRALLAFKQEVQRIVIAFTKEKQSQQITSEYMRALGLPSKLTVDSGDIKGEVITEPEKINGQPRSYFTDEALTEMDTAALNDYRRSTWQYLKRQIAYRDLDQDTVFGYLAQLGFTLPEIATSVVAEVPDGRGDVTSVTFRLPGDVSVEEVLGKLNEQYKGALPEVNAVRAAFGTAAENLRQPVIYARCESEVKWAAAETANGLA